MERIHAMPVVLDDSIIEEWRRAILLDIHCHVCACASVIICNFIKMTENRLKSGQVDAIWSLPVENISLRSYSHFHIFNSFISQYPSSLLSRFANCLWHSHFVQFRNKKILCATRESYALRSVTDYMFLYFSSKQINFANENECESSEGNIKHKCVCVHYQFTLHYLIIVSEMAIQTRSKGRVLSCA